MSVHYKFKAALDFSTVTFDGIHISVADLKKEIFEQKHLKQSADSDLRITNAQTEAVYEDENALIPKNTSVIVARVPVTADKRRNTGPGGGGGFGQQRGRHHLPRNLPPSIQPSAMAKEVDLASMDATEEEKIKAMMSQSTADYDPSKYARIRGSGQHGRVPPSYRCNKCNQGGHWIKDCPFQPDHLDVKKSTGIPRSFMVHVEGPGVPGALMTPEGRFAVPAVDHAAYKAKTTAEPPPPKPKIPEELVCTLCEDLMTDALLVPCCANSYCDECIRKALLDSDDQECPSCHEKDILPNSLIANRFLRTTVTKFKNETGYSKPMMVTKKDPIMVVDLTDKGSKVDLTNKEEAAERRKVSLDELPDDLFPHSPRKIDPDAMEENENELSHEQDDEKDKTDLYDFNEGSIPSPFANAQADEKPFKETTEQTIKTIGTTTSHNVYTEPKPMRGPPPHPMDRDRHPMDRHQPDRHPMDRHPMDRHHPQHVQNYHQNRPPLKEHYRQRAPGPPMHQPPTTQYQHSQQPPPRRQPPPMMQGHGPPHDRPPPDMHEPPPGFGGDVLPLPPGEDRIPTPTSGRRDDNLRPWERGERDGNVNSDGPPAPPKTVGLLPLPGIPPFNPTEPPPSSFPPTQTSSQLPPPQDPNKRLMPPSQGMFPGPPGPQGPPPHNFPYPGSGPDYRMNERHGPPPMYHSGGPPMGPNRDGHYPRTMRKPFFRDSRPRERERLEDQVRPAGAIEDPLKEFERLMREKDRRQKLQQQPMMSRSRSRSFSPGPGRRTPSPFARRSRSRSPFSRSPSPSFGKRKRPGPPLRRRGSYSRSPSRSPPRRHLRSRSRSRNRSRSPAPLSKLRAQRRGPPLRPYSPSPPSSRFPPARKDKDEFYENRPPRYDAPAGPGNRHYNSNTSNNGSHNSKPFSSMRDYNDPSSKEYMPPHNKYMGQQKFESYSGELAPPPVGPSGNNKFEKFDHRGPPPASRGGYHHHQSGGSMYREREGRGMRMFDRGANSGEIGVDRDRREDRPPIVSSDFDTGIMPPGTEGTMPAPGNSNNSNNPPILPSLFELSIPSPTNYPPSKVQPSLLNPPESSSSNYYPPTATSTSSSFPSQPPSQGPPTQHHMHQQQSSGNSEKERRPRSYGQSDRDRGDDRSLRERPDMRERDMRDRSDTRGRDRGRGDRDAMRERDRDLESLRVSLTPDSFDIRDGRDRDGKKRLLKKSRENSSEKLDKKRERKEKKKHKKKKEKEEKKIRKSKKSKPSGKSGGKGGSEDDQTTMSSLDEGGPPSRRNSTSDNNTGALVPTLKDTPLDGVKKESVQDEKIESIAADVKAESGHEIDAVNSNLTVIVCDSTVKSPDRNTLAGLPQKSTTLDPDSVSTKDTTNLISNDEAKKGDGEQLNVAKTESSTDDMTIKDDGPKGNDDSFEDSNKMTEISPMVLSKWDQFGEDEDVSNTMISNTAENSMKTCTDDSGNVLVSKELTPKKVTSEVLKRAENAIFQKAISGISSGPNHSSTTTSNTARKSSPPPHQPSSSKRKVYVEKLENPDSDNEDSKGKDLNFEKSGSNFQVTLNTLSTTDSSSKPDTGTSTSGKRSVHDRLGSKIDDGHSSKSRHRSSSSSRDRDKNKGRHQMIKSQVISGSSYHREQIDRNRRRSPQRIPRSPSGRYRGGGRMKVSRSRSKEDRGRERARFNDRRSRSKSTKRSTSKSRRDRQRNSRSLSRVRKLNRLKEPLKLSKARSRSSSREKRYRNKPSQAVKKNSDNLVVGSVGTAEGSQVNELSGPVLKKKVSMSDDESSGDNFSSNKSNPVPLIMRKEKGRINIKLSSTTAVSKGDPNKSSSSSSEDEHHKHDPLKPARSSESDDGKKKSKKEKKKGKRQRSESSSSSSSSNDSAPRKSKKSKKKKKKSKKKRRQK